MTTATLDRIARTSAYGDLVREFPPRLIRTKNALESTFRVIDRLMGVASPSKDQLEYLELLSTLAERYESAGFPTPTTSLKSLLAHLIEARGVSQAELARHTGIGVSTISDVLAGRRSLSLKNILRLSRYFSVDSSLFLEARRP